MRNLGRINPSDLKERENKLGRKPQVSKKFASLATVGAQSRRLKDVLDKSRPTPPARSGWGGVNANHASSQEPGAVPGAGRRARCRRSAPAPCPPRPAPPGAPHPQPACHLLLCPSVRHSPKCPSKGWRPSHSEGRVAECCRASRDGVGRQLRRRTRRKSEKGASGDPGGAAPELAGLQCACAAVGFFFPPPAPVRETPQRPAARGPAGHGAAV